MWSEVCWLWGLSQVLLTRLHMLLTLCTLTWSRSTSAVTSLLPAACRRPSTTVKSVSIRRLLCGVHTQLSWSLKDLRDSSPAPCAAQPGSWKDKQAWQNNPLKFFMETNLAYLVKENSCYSFLMRLMLWEISPSAYSLSRILCCPGRYSPEWYRQHMPAGVALTQSYFCSVL